MLTINTCKIIVKKEEDVFSFPFPSNTATDTESRLEHSEQRKKSTVFFVNSGYISPNTLIAGIQVVCKFYDMYVSQPI